MVHDVRGVSTIAAERRDILGRHVQPLPDKFHEPRQVAANGFYEADEIDPVVVDAAKKMFARKTALFAATVRTEQHPGDCPACRDKAGGTPGFRSQ